MLLFYAISVFILFLLSDGKKLSVTSVSTLNDTNMGYGDMKYRYLYGSVAGGTVLYIKGTGFQNNPSKNSVMIGNYPCVIPRQGVKEETLICVTSSILPQKYAWGLQIMIQTNKEKVNATETFTYDSYSYTPEIQEVYPSHAFASQSISFIGRHLISDLGDGNRAGQITGLYIGEDHCTRTGINQPPINSTHNETIKCNAPEKLEAGRYSVKEHVDPGIAIKLPNVQKTSIYGNLYEFAMIPTVNEVSPNNGSVSGTRMIIKGSGFPATNNRRNRVKVTVDNTDCRVIRTSTNEITCNLVKKSNTSEKIPNSANTSAQTYISGSGFRYRRYSIPGTKIEAFEAVETSSTTASKLKEESVRGQLSSICEDCGEEIEVFEGYFYAPNQGAYTFVGYSTKQFKAYLNPTAGVPALEKPQHLLISGAGNKKLRNSYEYENETQSKTLTLDAGKYYYMKVYNRRAVSADNFSILAEIPNTNATLKQKPPQIQKIILNFTNQSPILRFRSIGPISGAMKVDVKVYIPWMPTPFEKSVTLPFNVNASLFCQTIKAFHEAYYIYNNNPTCERKYLDQNMNELPLTAMGSQIHGYEWIVTYQLPAVNAWQQYPREFTTQMFNVTYVNVTTANGIDPKFSQEIIQFPGPVINGTFNIMADNQYINYTGYSSSSSIDFNPSLYSFELEQTLKNHFKFNDIIVTQDEPFGWWGGRLGKNWTIQYNNPPFQFPELTFITDNLHGGAPLTRPEIYFETINQFTNNLVYHPISFELMRTFAMKPAVVVQVNEVMSMCLSSCEFFYLNGIPEISSLQMNGPHIIMNLTTTVLKTNTKTQIKIGGQNACKRIEIISTNVIRCEFDTNAHGNPVFPAGSYFPQLWIDKIGFVEYVFGVPALIIGFGVQNPVPIEGSVLGGLQVNVSGKGLPKLASDLSITVCDLPAEIKEINPSFFTFMTPEIESDFVEETKSCKIGVKFDKHDSTTIFEAGFFTYKKEPNPPTINSLGINEANPTKKGVLFIYGSGFDINDTSDISLVKVHLIGTDIDKKYPMKVMSVNDTVIKVGLSGGMSGNYTVSVEIMGRGFAKSSSNGSAKFAYVNKVSEVFPMTGSYFGGRVVQIIGSSFSPDTAENEVHIGDQICGVIFANSSLVKCIAPAKDQSSSNLEYQVNVISRQISNSTCFGNCKFTYLPLEQSPYITGMDYRTISQPNISIIIDGSNFYIQNFTTKVQAIHRVSRKKYIFTPTEYNSTHVTFIPTPLPGGEYFLFVDIEDLGYSNMIILTVETHLYSYDDSISTQGGILNIRGFGFPESVDTEPFSIEIFDAANGVEIEPNIVKLSADLIQIELESRGKNSTLSVIFKYNQAPSTVFSIHYLETKTPQAKVISGQLIPWKGTQQILLSKGVNAEIYPPTSVKVFSKLSPQTQIELEWDHNDTFIRIMNNTLEPGVYSFRINSMSGYYQINETISIILTNVNQIFTFNTGNLSMEGGFIYVQHQQDALPASFGKHVSFFFNGEKAQVQRFNDTSVKVFYGPFVKSDNQMDDQISTITVQTEKQRKQALKKLKALRNRRIPLQNYVKWSDSGIKDLTEKAFDKYVRTSYSSSNSNCEIGVYFGNQQTVEINRIRFYPNRGWSKPGQYLNGGMFQGSNDNSTWQTIQTLDSKVRRGWNLIIIPKAAQKTYRYFRFSHNSVSNCNLGSIVVRGSIINDPIIQTSSNLVQESVVLSYSDGVSKFEWLSELFRYSEFSTPIIQTVTPRRGNVRGGETLTLTGSGLSGTPSVVIDGKVCQVFFSSQTLINCTTSPRLETPVQIKFDVTISGRSVILKEKFEYVYRWSNIDTWGVDLPPVEGDLIYIPPNMHLYIDESTPKLAGIIAENSTVEIADQVDIQINTANLILMGARLIAGTAEKPFVHKLTFTFYGSESENQIPFFGNKGIGCTNCQISLHGAQKEAWIEAGTIVQGSNFVGGSRKQPLNWKVGDEIAVAPSSFDYLQGQKMTIETLNPAAGSLNFTTKQSFAYPHISNIEQTKTGSVFLATHIGVLSRNIRLQGDSNSDSTEYGIHITLIGSDDTGLEVKISNVELRNCGQPKKERHCINFNRNLQMATSYIKNSTAANTYAKFITIQSTNMLQISSNVGYMVKGHGIELLDGIEENNTIVNNLIISSLPYYRGMQTDVMVASYYISNPNNVIRDNVAAGSYYYGFLYDLKSKSDHGLYAHDDLCTAGYTLGENDNNVAHSVRKIAVRVKELIVREKPCSPTRNDLLADPWSVNPSKPSLFSNYILFKNQQLGLMCDDIGHVVFENWTMVENLKSHMQFHVMNYTKERVRVSGSTFVGVSSLIDTPSNLQTKGLVLPRSGSINFTDILFKKYVTGQTIIQTCALCNDPQYYTNNGQQYFFDKVQYDTIQSAIYLEMTGLKKEIIYDLDGSLTSNRIDTQMRTRATVVSNLNYILDEPGCVQTSNIGAWGAVAVCNQNVIIRKVTFMNIGPASFSNSFPPKVQRVARMTTQSSRSTSIPTMLLNLDVSAQIKNSWSSPFVAGSTYKLEHNFNLNHLDIQTSPLTTPSDKAIIFKLAYNSSYELFDVYKKRNLVRSSNPLTSQPALLQHNTCKNGDYYHNNSIKEFQVCSSGRDIALYELIDINPVFCRFDCSKPPVIVPPTPTPPQNITPTPPQNITPTPPYVDPNICIRETFVRKWSNVTQWPGERLPLAGQNVTVHCNWTVELDIDPAPAALLIIDGNVIVPQNRPLINVTAESIWVRLGNWTFGNSSNPFGKPVVIQLNGQRSDRGMVVDANYGGRKNLVVSGRLQIYGETNFDEVTYLSQDTMIGKQQISVQSSNGWKVGDQIVLSTTSRAWNQSEKVKIVSINSTHIKISPPLQFFHHGADFPSIYTDNSKLYTASRVIHLTRKIKIINGNDQSFGFSVFVYGFLDTNGNYQMGSVNLRGVEFQNGGQGSNFDPVLAFRNTVTSNQSSQISKCSFNKCNGQCVVFTNARNFAFENNVLFDAMRTHIRTVQPRRSIISSNIMIMSSKDPNSQQNTTVCLEGKQMFNTAYQDNVSFITNECHGSEDVGFILPYMPCNEHQDLIKGNIASSCQIGFFMIKLGKENARCVTCANVKVFNSKFGVLGNPDQIVTLIYDRLILAGNQEGLILRFSTKEKNNTARVIRSHISAIADPNCIGCHFDVQSCSNAVGIRLLSVTESPSTKPGFNATQIRSSSPVDAKTFIEKVEFAYFMSTYHTFLPIYNCSNNFIFKAHEQAVDLVGSTYLHHSVLLESGNDSYAYFRPFDTKNLGLEGGCGELNCTSLENYFIQDVTGGVFGQMGNKVLPNNLDFSNKTFGCNFVSNMNGYFCNSSEQVSVLEFQSIAKDFNTRIVWPVNLISHNSDEVNNTLNVQKEWSYRNGYPEGRRKARLSSLIKLNNTYNLTFFSRAPADIIFQLQQKSPDAQQFGWVKLVLQYPDQNSIRMKANDVDKEPIILRDNQTEGSPSQSQCGSYKYVYNKKYIEYILTTDCRIRMSFINSVKATIRLDQQVSDFFSNNGTAKFIDKMSKILGITDTSRLKIVGVYTGSTIVDFYVEEQHVTTQDDSTTATPSAEQSAAAVAEINNKLQEAVANGQVQTAFASVGLGTVLEASSTIVLVNETGVFQTDMSQAQNQVLTSTSTDQGFFSGTTKTIIIGAASGLGLLLIMVVAIVYFRYMRRQNSVENESIVEEQKKNEVQVLEMEKSEVLPKSFFEDRKAINFESLKKKTKVKGDRTMAQNNSMVSIKNPFDEYYMPQISEEQLQ